MPDLTPDQSREAALDSLRDQVVRIQDELDRMIQLHCWMREALEKEMFSGMGYKQLTANEKDLKKLKDLTVSMDSLVACKIKWDKAQKTLAASMTRKEEIDAVFQFLCTLDPTEINNLRHRLNDKGIFKWKT